MVVLVTGAGFSRALGLPQTSELMDRLISALETTLAHHPLRHLERPVPGTTERSAWPDSLSPLPPINQLATLYSLDRDLQSMRFLKRTCTSAAGLDDLEHIATAAWEAGDSSAWLKELTDESLSQVHHGGRGRLLFYRLMALEADILDAEQQAVPNDLVGRLMDRIAKNFGSIKGVVTLNYDVLLDVWAASNLGFESLDFGLPFKDVEWFVAENQIWPAEPYQVALRTRTVSDLIRPFPILKLHGGLNLGYCPVSGCGKIVSSLDATPFKRAAFPADPVGHLHMPIGYHCPPSSRPLPGDGSEGRVLRPLLVPPTSVKHDTPEWSRLEAVHASAIELLESADDILFAGLGFARGDFALKRCVDAAARSQARIHVACGSTIPAELEKLSPSLYGDGYLHAE